MTLFIKSTPGGGAQAVSFGSNRFLVPKFFHNIIGGAVY